MKKISVQVIENSNLLTPYINIEAVVVSVSKEETGGFVSASSDHPAVILLDYNIRGKETLEYIALLNKSSPDSKIVLIADNRTEDEIMRFFLAGARGYLPVQDIGKFLNKCIRAVNNGEAWMTRKMIVKLLAKLREQTQNER